VRGELVFMAKLQGYGSKCIKQIGQVISEIVWNESDAIKVGKLELHGRVPNLAGVAISRRPCNILSSLASTFPIVLEVGVYKSFRHLSRAAVVKSF
jgi:hypothetical protein